MGPIEGLLIAIVVFALIVRAIYRSIRWLIQQIKTVGVAPSPIQQAIAEAQRQQATTIQPTRQKPLPRMETELRPLPRPRRPDAGGPAVPREATNADFDRSEREMLTAEPSPLDVPLRSSLIPKTEASFQLFQDTDDLIRAVILQEVLGPPLSRRSSAR